MRVDQYIALLRRQIGKPYVLGAEANLSDPNPPKFDCSELVQWSYAQATISIPDLAATQYDVTKPVTGSPQTGDLVFLKNNPARWNRVGHVAIISAKLTNGDYEVIEARGRAWGVVRTTYSYWKTRKYYAGLRRYPKFVLKPAIIVPYSFSTLEVDGVFGPKTIKALQYWMGLTPNGLWDSATKKALQKRLGVTVDGDIGPKTVSALQFLVGAKVDKVWGIKTTTKLQVYLNKVLGGLSTT